MRNGHSSAKFFIFREKGKAMIFTIIFVTQHFILTSHTGNVMIVHVAGQVENTESGNGNGNGNGNSEKVVRRTYV